MNKRHLNYFLAVAKYLSFSLASQELYISQPALSHAISDFEDSLGTKLFYRKRGRLELTPAGECLQKDAPNLLQYEAQIVRRIQEANEHKRWALNIGVLGTNRMGQFSSMINMFYRMHANYDLTINHYTWNEMLPALQDEVIDIAFLLAFDWKLSQPNTKIVFTRLCSAPLCVFARQDHPLAQKAHVSFQDLKDEIILCADQKAEPETYNMTTGSLQTHNVVPRAVKTVADNYSVFAMAQAGQGVFISSAFISLPISPEQMELKSMALEDGENIHLCLAHRKDTHNPAVDIILRIAAEIEW